MEWAMEVVAVVPARVMEEVDGAKVVGTERQRVAGAVVVGAGEATVVAAAKTTAVVTEAAAAAAEAAEVAGVEEVVGG